MGNRNAKIMFIDNFDSFTYNLVDDFCKRGCEAKIYRSDTGIETLAGIAAEYEPDLLVISPGPGTPDTAGVTLKAIDYFKDKLCIFGVCLGMQSIVQYFGGKITHAPLPMHGKPTKVTHNDESIFEGLENPLQAGRYHSLCPGELPSVLDKTAWYEDIIMGVEHKELPIYGVQFHPESILTPAGGKIIQNVINIAKGEKLKS